MDKLMYIVLVVVFALLLCTMTSLFQIHNLNENMALVEKVLGVQGEINDGQIDINKQNQRYDRANSALVEDIYERLEYCRCYK